MPYSLEMTGTVNGSRFIKRWVDIRHSSKVKDRAPAGNHFGTERNVTLEAPKLASKELIGPLAETSSLIIPQTITMEIK